MPAMKLRPRIDETGGSDFLRGKSRNQIVHHNDTIEVGSLARGMASGKPSVMLCFRLPDGRVLVAETSLALFTAAAVALTAAHEQDEQ